MIKVAARIVGLMELDALGQRVAQSLVGGAVWALHGELGAGKTTFTQAVTKALGLPDIVASPTFVLERVYSTSKGWARDWSPYITSTLPA